MTRVIRLYFPDGSYHTIEVSKFVSSRDGDKDVLSIWYKDLDEIERTGEEVGSFTLLRKNADNTYTHLFCGDEYDAIYQGLYDNIQKGKYVDISLYQLPLTISSSEEYDYFAKEEPATEAIEDNTSNVIKINKLDEYLIYKYTKTIDVGDFTIL